MTHTLILETPTDRAGADYLCARLTALSQDAGVPLPSLTWERSRGGYDLILCPQSPGKDAARVPVSWSDLEACAMVAPDLDFYLVDLERRIVDALREVESAITSGRRGPGAVRSPAGTVSVLQEGTSPVAV